MPSLTQRAPPSFKKAVDGYKINKIEASLTGKVSQKEKKIILTTAAGTVYTLAVAEKPECCADLAAAKKDEAKKDVSPFLKALQAKIDGFAKEGKLAKVSGVVAECCDVEVLVASIDAVEKATN